MRYFKTLSSGKEENDIIAKEGAKLREPNRITDRKKIAGGHRKLKLSRAAGQDGIQMCIRDRHLSEDRSSHTYTNRQTDT